VKLLVSNVCAASGISVVKFMLSSFPLLFVEGWFAAERGVDARSFFGRLMVATTAAPPRITFRRDKQLDSSSESGATPDFASFVRVRMFIAIPSVGLGSEVERLQIAFLASLDETTIAFITPTSAGFHPADLLVNKFGTTSLAACAT
jgi:hypothetical protein